MAEQNLSAAVELQEELGTTEEKYFTPVNGG